MGLKLALCASLQDHLVGEEAIADYLLYWLNSHGKFEYVDYMGLQEPCDDINKVLFGFTFCTYVIFYKGLEGTKEQMWLMVSHHRNASPATLRVNNVLLPLYCFTKVRIAIYELTHL